MNKILNKRNGIIGAIIVVIVVGAIVATTTFSQAMTLDQAKEVAKKYVPSTAEFVTSEEEDTKFEVVFYDKTNKETFETEVSMDTKNIKKVESQLDNDLGSKTVKLKKAEVESIVKERFGDVTGITVTLNKDDGLQEYSATFNSKEFYGDADINPETGAVLESTVKYGTAVTIPNGTGNKNELLTVEEAKTAAIKETGGGVVKDIDLEKKNGEYVYEVEVVKDKVEYDYYVDAKTGKVTLEHKHDAYLDYDDNDNDNDDNDDDDYNQPAQGTGNNSSSTGTSGNIGSGNTSAGNSGTSTSTISIEQARNIVLGKIPGANIIKIYLEQDDGIAVYEGEATLNGYEYDFEINAASGVIISWDKDKIDIDDDNDDDDQWDD